MNELLRHEIEGLQVPFASLPDAAFDVIVIGAGPAGSAAAIHLAARGHSVLLTDKERFPREKACGDGIMADAMRCLGRMGLSDDVVRFGHSLRRASLFSPSGIEFDIPGEYVTLRRVLLDGILVRKAVSHGARFCHGEAGDVAVRQDGTVTVRWRGSDRTVAARACVLALGSRLGLARELGVATTVKPSAVAVRCYVASEIFPDRLIGSFHPSVLPGYGWIFPMGDGISNVGCISFSGGQRNLNKTFTDFTTRFPLARELFCRGRVLTPLRGGMLRCGLTGTPAVGPGNIVAIGETIGTTYPLTGEGIGKAMETGEIAASAIHEALVTGDWGCLRGYQRRLDEELRPRYQGYEVAGKWLSTPWLNDFMAWRVTRSRYLRDAVAGIITETVDPRTVFSFRGILRSFFGP